MAEKPGLSLVLVALVAVLMVAPNSLAAGSGFWGSVRCKAEACLDLGVVKLGLGRA